MKKYIYIVFAIMLIASVYAIERLEVVGNTYNDNINVKQISQYCCQYKAYDPYGIMYANSNGRITNNADIFKLSDEWGSENKAIVSNVRYVMNGEDVMNPYFAFDNKKLGLGVLPSEHIDVRDDVRGVIGVRVTHDNTTSPYAISRFVVAMDDMNQEKFGQLAYFGEGYILPELANKISLLSSQNSGGIILDSKNPSSEIDFEIGDNNIVKVTNSDLTIHGDLYVDGCICYNGGCLGTCLN